MDVIYALIYLAVFIRAFRVIHCKGEDRILQYDIINLNYSNRQLDSPFNQLDMFRTNCPVTRANPDMRIVPTEIQYNQNCQRMNEHAAKCPGIHTNCQEIIRIQNLDKFVHGNYTISMLFNFTCDSTGETNLFRWGVVSLLINCNLEENTSEIKLTYARAIAAFTYRLKEVNPTIHLLLQGTRGSVQAVFLNTTLVERQTATAPYDTEELRVIVFGSSKGLTFNGSISKLDVFYRHLNGRERNIEYKYMVNVATGNKYPECICKKYTEPNAGLLCHDGKSRLTGTSSHNIQPRPVKAIHDGICNTSLTYGSWSFPQVEGGVKLQIALLQMAEINRIELICQQAPLQVSHKGLSGVSSNLFWIGHDGAKDASVIETAIPGTEVKLYNYTWQQDRTTHQMIITKFLTFAFFTRIYVYEITVYGRWRPLAPALSARGCNCFPGNGKDRDNICDDCGRCKCRTNYSDFYCSPFLDQIAPSYGPKSGGTAVTITGGLLLPGRSSTKEMDPQGLSDLCARGTVKYTDTTISCLTHRSKSIDNVTTVNIEVSIPIGGVYFPIEKEFIFDYKPDPKISKILPYKALASGGHTIQVKGENLDSVYTFNESMKLFVADKVFNGSCKLVNQNEVLCGMPDIPYPSTTPVDLGFIFDGVKEYQNVTSLFGSFDIYPLPIFSSNTLMTGEDGLIRIEGEELTRCCDKDEYTVHIKDRLCKILNISSSHITCIVPDIDDSGRITVSWYGRIFEAGFLDAPSSPIGNNVSILITTLVLLLLIIVSIILIRRKRRGMARVYHFVPRKRFKNQFPLVRPQDSLLDSLDPELKRMVKNQLIRFWELDIRSKLGSGNFGTVYEGFLKRRGCEEHVALKTLRDGQKIQKAELSTFLEEATIMKDFDHPNILTLIGIMIHEGQFYVVLPIMAKGDLRQHVKKEPFEQVTFTTFAHDIAKGMAYLETNQFVHRDLAARNCMVHANGSVLVGDFGLARDLYQKDYYRSGENMRPMPLKWMAIECLEDNIYSTKSDVWAFGVVMWEIYTNGNRPFCGIDNIDLWRCLKGGRRPEQPDKCPDNTYTLMKSCWMIKPDDRPSFASLVTALEDQIRSPPPAPSRVYVNKICANQALIPCSSSCEAIAASSTTSLVPIAHHSAPSTTAHVAPPTLQKLSKSRRERRSRSMLSAEAAVNQDPNEYDVPPSLRKSVSEISAAPPLPPRRRPPPPAIIAPRSDYKIPARVGKCPETGSSPLPEQALPPDYFIPVDPATKNWVDTM